jgi:glycolate oxidase FAD binding subunit
MMVAPDRFVPRDASDATDIVSFAQVARRTLSISGGKSRARLGRPAPADIELSTALMTGVLFYEPAEMVVSVRAGTPLREMETLLAEHGQMLGFEPMDHRALFGSTGEPTVGAVAACNLSGPRRVQAGAARDALLGLGLVNGLGQAIRLGGRVMKNVTGLDLTRLCCGAYGTLGLITEATFRTQPKPELSVTLVYEGLSDARGVALLSMALGSPFGVSGAAHLPPGLGQGEALTLLRVEGFATSVAHRIARLEHLLAGYGDARREDGKPEVARWATIRDGSLLAEPATRSIWRVSLKPSDAAAYVAALSEAVAVTHFYDWGGGLVWLAVETSADCGAEPIRQRLAPFGGHATLVRAPEGTGTDIVRFSPLSQAEMQLSRAIKASFDPVGIFNPGRMYSDR